MNTTEVGRFGESLVYERMTKNGIKCSWVPMGGYGDFITEDGVLIDVKICNSPIPTKNGNRLWRFNASHHAHQQTEIDVFVFVAKLDRGHLVFVFPAAMVGCKNVAISNAQIGRGKYNYFLENWDIIKNYKPQTPATLENRKKEARSIFKSKAFTGRDLGSIRRVMRMSVRDLADVAGCAPATAQAWEQGRRIPNTALKLIERHLV